jgi:hypothetical protein
LNLQGAADWFDNHRFVTLSGWRWLADFEQNNHRELFGASNSFFKIISFALPQKQNIQSPWMHRDLHKCVDFRLLT